tara:strand:+ start:168 stop:707 length:540 start_codon:yes stop_codon:yes gene_type:complete
MNMLQPHRRTGRRRTAPKRFEDEKFVSGAIDRYQHCYDANRPGKYDHINGHENYYTSRRGNKFTTIEWNDKGKYRIHKRDFTESLLEFSSIWRDMGRVLPGAIVSNIGSFLRLSETDQHLIADDDEFVVGDDSDTEEVECKTYRCSGLPMEDESEEEWDSEEETDDESSGHWSEYSDED